MSLLKFLGLSGETAAESPSSAQTETVRKIARELDAMPPERARYIASFAYILGRAAHADLDISEEETQTMERIVTELGHVPEEQAVIVVQIAKTQNVLFGHTENYLVTREFNRLATREQKMALLECLFAISASDEDVSSAEDSEIRQIASELKLEHREFIAVRSRFRRHLAVLKNRPENSEE